MMRLKTMIKVTRAPFFASLVTSVLVGTTLAWHKGSFHWGYFLLTLIGIVCINAGMNMSNDYFDHLSGNDEVNQELTPFSGGSRTIQEGILSAKQVLMWSLLFFLVGIVIGLYLAFARGWLVLWLGLTGVSIAFFSSAPPFRLNYLGHGLGELATGIGTGPLIVLGSHYVQSQRTTYEALWASILMGLLGAALIWINEFPDYEADRAVGKKTLVVLLGRQRAVWGYIGLLVAFYVVVVVGVALSLLPSTLLLAFLSLPLAYRGIRGVMRFHSNTPRLIPASAATIQLYLANGLLLCLGYAIEKIL
ncbi:MAG: 1,4-dihydroxy-2-naphthoate octaprenyltransferase [Anaerolineae bacterium]